MNKRPPRDGEIVLKTQNTLLVDGNALFKTGFFGFPIKKAYLYINKNMRIKKTTKEFIDESNLVHSNRYRYHDEYLGNKIKIKITCPEHGEFEQRPINHLSGQGCPKCGEKKNLTHDEFLTKSKLIYGSKYNYPNKYHNSKTKIGIECLTHGVFYQRPNDHLSGQGCGLCQLELKPNLSDFIERAKLTHGNKYGYSNVLFKNNYTKVNIVCEKHGSFYQRPNDHIRGNGCPICRESKGEKEIRLFLVKNNIKFEQQFIFNDCKDIRPLPFDFYLPDYDTCIEFHGIQHFEFNLFFHKTIIGLQNQLLRDKIKSDYCSINNIRLMVINYYDIKELVMNKLKSLI